MARVKSSKTVAEQLQKLQDEMKAAEQAEVEELGRWVVKELSPSRKQPMADRVEEVRKRIRAWKESEAEITGGSSSKDGSAGYADAGSTSDEQVDAPGFI